MNANRRTSLSKERYLELRRAGHTTEQIARDHNCTHRALQAMRGRWRLIADEDEAAALAALDASGECAAVPVDKAAPDTAVAIDEAVAAPEPPFAAEHQPHEDAMSTADDTCIIIRIPVSALIDAGEKDRNESLAQSFDMALAALGRARLDLQDLLGDVDTAGCLQRYVDRKLSAYLEARG